MENPNQTASYLRPDGRVCFKVFVKLFLMFLCCFIFFKIFLLCSHTQEQTTQYPDPRRGGGGGVVTPMGLLSQGGFFHLMPGPLGHRPYCVQKGTPSQTGPPRDTHTLRQRWHLLQESTTRHLLQGEEREAQRPSEWGPGPRAVTRRAQGCLLGPRPCPAPLSLPSSWCSVYGVMAAGGPDRGQGGGWPCWGDARMQPQVTTGSDTTRREDPSVLHTDALGRRWDLG